MWVVARVLFSHLYKNGGSRQNYFKLLFLKYKDYIYSFTSRMFCVFIVFCCYWLLFLFTFFFFFGGGGGSGEINYE